MNLANWRKGSIMSQQQISGVLVTLHVAGLQVLYVMLTADGTINRMGTGVETNVESELFIGKLSSDAFALLKARVTPVVPHWIGTHTDPERSGKECRLTIGLLYTDGSELISRWVYGTNSQSPPPDICDIVLETIELTNPWFERQKQLASRE